jgi:hypothetical protein
LKLTKKSPTEPVTAVPKRERGEREKSTTNMAEAVKPKTYRVSQQNIPLVQHTLNDEAVTIT